MRDPVVITGGGIVGLSTAWALTKDPSVGRVVVLEKEGGVAEHQTGRNSGVVCRAITSEELREREPYVVGRAAIQVDDTGIVDYRGVCARLVQLIERAGGEVRTGARLFGIRRDGNARVLMTTVGEVRTRFLVNCAGVYADRIARLDGVDPGLQIVPFRGHYYELAPSARRFCRHLIYPVPDPAYPFLGVHFTRMTNGSVECGPNALLAFAREGYELFDVDPRDLLEVLRYPGFQRLAARHWRMGVTEYVRAVSRRSYLKALRRLVPEVAAADLHPAPSGIRAQALLSDGSMADDFVIRQAPGAVHVCNAPSPAATAALEIGRYIASRVQASR